MKIYFVLKVGEFSYFWSLNQDPASSCDSFSFHKEHGMGTKFFNDLLNLNGHDNSYVIIILKVNDENDYESARIMVQIMYPN